MDVNNPTDSSCGCTTFNYSSKEGTVALTTTQANQTYTVSFSYPTDQYGFDRLYVENLTSTQTGLGASVTAKTAAGFTFKLWANPANNNAKLYWRISPLLTQV